MKLLLIKKKKKKNLYLEKKVEGGGGLKSCTLKSAVLKNRNNQSLNSLHF
jgi:hypothetical protein